MKKITSSAAAGIATQRNATQRNAGNLRILERFLPMLTLLIACSISAGGVRAQCSPTILSDAASEYSFRVQQAFDGQGFNPPCGTGITTANTDPAPVLSMSCLAANGYGQWTYSTTAGGTNTNANTGVTAADEFPSGWYLLANGLYQPSIGHESTDAINHPQCIPPGVVQCGTFSYPSSTQVTLNQVKAVANLNGMSAFIWAQSDGTAFVQSGFTAADVDLSLSFLSNPQPVTQVLPTPTGNMNVVTYAIHTGPSDWPPISVGTHMITTSSGDWRGNFDVCADASYIYIVWGSIPAAPPHHEQIWVTVIPIGSGTAVTGFPRMIPGSGDICVNPTITCDPRAGGSAAFDVSYIDQTTNKIMVASYSLGVLSTPAALSYNYWNPNLGIPHQATESYEIPFHARIIRSSINGGTSSLAVYATVANSGFTLTGDGAGDAWLIFYPPSNILGTANYVAGSEISAPSPISADRPVRDDAIIAFADPYDNQSGWHSTDEFHCLYQYDLSMTTISPTEYYPLCIVRGSDIGAAYPPQPDGTTLSTSLVLNQTGGSGSILENDPIGDADVNGEYVAAVNQMGIHVHWRTIDGVHFYARDMNRTFDEPVEENTLVTDQCFVTDGSVTGTNHGGTAGAMIRDLLRMTVWSDPNYGPPSLDGSFGLYSPPPPGILTTLSTFVGTLNFTGTTGTGNPNGNNVVLTVGDGLDCAGGDDYYICPANLTVMPYFYFNFNSLSPFATGQGVTVNANSTFDYYGLIARHHTDGSINTLSTPFTDGTIDGVGGGTITLQGVTSDDYPAILNVHGGADFFTGGGDGGYAGGAGAGGVLVSNYSTINVLDEAAVYPTTSGSPNPAATGHMTLLGQTTLTSGSIFGNIPYVSEDMVGGQPAFSRRVIMTVDYGFNASGSGVPQFLATSTAFQNSDSKGTSELVFGHADRTQDGPSFEKSQFEYCTGDAIEIHGIDPAYGTNVSELDVEGCNFTDIRNKCIFVENDLDPTTGWYGIIKIDGNTFGAFAPDIDDWTVSEELVDSNHYAAHYGPISSIPAPFGIYLKNFDANEAGGFIEGSRQYTVPVISNNQFTYSGNWNMDLNAQSSRSVGNYGTGSSAIALENTTAMVLSNTISDNGYSAGVGLRWDASFNPNTFSVICSNTINGLDDDNVESENDEMGISSNFSIGVISSNSINGNDIGIESFHNDAPFMLYNNDTGNREIQLEVNLNSTGKLSGMPRLSGAYNTFSGPTEDASEMVPIDGGSEYIPEQVAIISCEGNGIDLEQGQNNIFYTSLPSDAHNNPLLFQANISLPAALGDIDGNWWGNQNGTIDPSISTYGNWNTTNSSEVDAENVDFTASSGGLRSDLSTIPSGVTCPAQAGHASTKQKGDKQLVIEDNNCDSIRFDVWNYNGAHDWQQAYDTAKKFIETCYNDHWAPEMFQEFSASLQPLAEADPTLWVEARQWLESVLYLNTSDPYFCACLDAIGATIHSPSDTSEEGHWQDEDRQLALAQWEIQNTTCDTPFIQNQFDATRATQYSEWLNDTMVPFDTTIPPLDSVIPGADTLLARHLLYENVGEPYAGILSNVTAYPDPASTGTVISFGISQEAYVKIELFNILGNEVASAGFESLFEPGNKSVPMSLVGLPSGTYFARILTAYGEVQSVKVVKE